MRKILLIIMTAALPVVFQACGSTFVASKHGKGYYLGSGSSAAYRMFCESEDLERILADAGKLGQDMKDQLYRYNCSSDRSPDRIRQIYSSLTREQRKDLRQAFRENGYDINAMPC
jgi:hypothetical protein